MAREMHRIDVRVMHDADLEVADHLRGLDTEIVDEPEESGMVVYIDPMLGQDGAIAALEQVLKSVRSDKQWKYLESKLTGRDG